MRKNFKNIYIILITINLIMVSTAFAQMKAFTGKVIDSSGNPVQGVELSVRENAADKQFTDSDGKFTLLALPGQHLVARMMNNEGKVIVLGDQPIISFVMDNTSTLLNIGYGQSEFGYALGSSVSSIGAGKLSKSSAFNPENALYGILPGLAVMQNGGVEGSRSPDMFIRGKGTMNNANILVLVDGFERPLSALAVDEIDRVTVLKDAAALAEYGQRGANGVLLVTTKRGVNNALKVDVSFEYGLNKAFRLPDLYDAEKYANAYNEALSNDGLPLRYSSYDLTDFKTGNSPDLFPNVNWFRQTLRDYGTNSKFNVSFLGGTKNVKYFTTLNYQSEDGLFDHANTNSYSTQAEYSRFNFRTNLDVDLSRTTKFQINVGGNIYNVNRPGTAVDDIFNTLYTIPSAAIPVKTIHGKWGGSTIYNNNPMAMLTATGFATTHSRTLLFDISLKQNLDKYLQGLSAELAVSYDNSATYWDGKTKKYQYESAVVQREASGAVSNTIYNLYGQETALSPYSSLGSQWRHSNFWGKLNYFNSWGENTLNTMLLYQQDKKTGNAQYNTFLHQSLVGSAQYSLSQKYFAALTVSYSGSSVLPVNDKFGLFPAISGAWLINKESFLENSKSIKLLKLRASWGITGNDLMSPNLYEQGYFSGTGSYFTANNTLQGGIYEGRLATQQLTYEKSYKTNVGFDANLFGKLSATLDMFFDKRTDILVTTAGNISSVIGVTPAFANLGIVKNKGVELSMDWNDQIGGLNYHFGGQFSFVRNEIVEMAESYKAFDYLKRTGHPIGQVFGMEAIGFFKDANEITNSPKQVFSTVAPGDIKYKDQNGDHIINELDEVPIGYSSGYPEIYYSFNLGFKYKGFGIDAQFQGTANQSVYLNTPGVFWPLRSNSTISSFSDDRWTPATSSTATLPRLTTLNNSNDFRSSTTWMRNGSYLKLRTAEVYFELPLEMVKKMKCKEVRIFARGMNLFSLDYIKAMDPEKLGTGYPTLSSYYLGVNLAF